MVSVLRFFFLFLFNLSNVNTIIYNVYSTKFRMYFRGVGWMFQINKEQLENKIQLEATRVIPGMPKFASCKSLYSETS